MTTYIQAGDLSVRFAPDFTGVSLFDLRPSLINGLLAYLPLINHPHDLMGRRGTLVNGGQFTIVDTILRKAYRNQAATLNYIRVNRIPFPASGPWSVNFWTTVRAITANTFFWGSRSSGPNQGTNCRILSTTQLRVTHAGVGDFDFTYSLTADIPLMLTFVQYEATTIALYVNGYFATSTTGAGFPLTSTGDFAIGATLTNSSPDAASYIDADIGHFSVWARPLNKAEVLDHYIQTKRWLPMQGLPIFVPVPVAAAAVAAVGHGRLLSRERNRLVI